MRSPLWCRTPLRRLKQEEDGDIHITEVKDWRQEPLTNVLEADRDAVERSSGISG